MLLDMVNLTDIAQGMAACCDCCRQVSRDGGWDDKPECVEFGVVLELHNDSISTATVWAGAMVPRVVVEISGKASWFLAADGCAEVSYCLVPHLDNAVNEDSGDRAVEGNDGEEFIKRISVLGVCDRRRCG
jgi:hypothetical protein